jgi:hypothetical protein
MVEDRHSQYRQPAVDRHEAVIATVDGGATHDPTVHRPTPVDRDTAVHPAFDRCTSVNAALHGVKAVNWQPSFEWIYALDGLAQPRLLRASAR